MDIAEFRKYRIILNDYPFFNNTSNGIALFDVFGTFIIAYFLKPFIQRFINLSTKSYYLLLIPFGILVHLIFDIDTFLNRMIFSEEINIYKLVILIMISALAFTIIINDKPPAYYETINIV